ncbi:hypothetical protein OC842_004754 [Tilletia horrida]|uniref:Uncharacterized protein n=1 Tax=Tilletia horrida TaxID=155126 RepID=A0AAN6G8L3_9BASI|nr:hypothetical protein OC842_004754 [Tilletia horrida]
MQTALEDLDSKKAALLAAVSDYRKLLTRYHAKLNWVQLLAGLLTSTPPRYDQQQEGHPQDELHRALHAYWRAMYELGWQVDWPGLLGAATGDYCSPYNFGNRLPHAPPAEIEQPADEDTSSGTNDSSVQEIMQEDGRKDVADERGPCHTLENGGEGDDDDGDDDKEDNDEMPPPRGSVSPHTA